MQRYINGKEMRSARQCNQKKVKVVLDKWHITPHLSSSNKHWIEEVIIFFTSEKIVKGIGKSNNSKFEVNIKINLNLEGNISSSKRLIESKIFKIES